MVLLNKAISKLNILPILLFVSLCAFILAACTVKQHGSIVYHVCVNDDEGAKNIVQIFKKIGHSNGLTFADSTASSREVFPNTTFMGFYNKRGSVMRLRNFENSLYSYYISITKNENILSAAERGKISAEVKSEVSVFQIVTYSEIDEINPLPGCR